MMNDCSCNKGESCCSNKSQKDSLCICKSEEQHLRTIQYTCKHCGTYIASVSRCEQCEVVLG